LDEKKGRGNERGRIGRAVPFPTEEEEGRAKCGKKGSFINAGGEKGP